MSRKSRVNDKSKYCSERVLEFNLHLPRNSDVSCSMDVPLSWQQHANWFQLIGSSCIDGGDCE